MTNRQNSNPISGINVLGEKREYIFKLMDAETSTRLFHQYAGILTQVHDMFMEFVIELSKMQNDGNLTAEQELSYNLLGTDSNIMFVIKKLPTIFTWEITAGLAKELLCGHSVKVGDESFEADEKGFLEKAGDPLEMYTALLYAVEANYPSYIEPLKLRMASLFQEDSTQESAEKETVKNETSKSK